MSLLYSFSIEVVGQAKEEYEKRGKETCHEVSHVSSYSNKQRGPTW